LVHPHGDPVAKALSTFGDEGWEVVAVIGDPTSSQGLTYVF
jgi:hypothetical protein